MVVKIYRFNIHALGPTEPVMETHTFPDPILTLTDEEFEQIMEMIENPPAPTEELRRMMKS